MKIRPEFCLTTLLFLHVEACRWSFQGTWHKLWTSCKKKRANSHYCFCHTHPRESRFWTRWVIFHSLATISHHETVPVWLSPANSKHRAWGSCWGATALQLIEMLNAVSFKFWKITSSTSSLQTVLFSASPIRRSRPVKCGFADFVRKRPL